MTKVKVKRLVFSIFLSQDSLGAAEEKHACSSGEDNSKLLGQGLTFQATFELANDNITVNQI